MSTARPALLFYCQHSLGMGHLVRTLHLVEALRADFRVVLLSGGRMPAGILVPEDVDLVELPPLGMDDAAGLVSQDARFNVEQAQSERLSRILEAFRRTRPSVVMVELFPFGRKKLAGEIMPLLRAAREAVHRPIVLCSLRDILVSDRRDQAAHDRRAVTAINEHFDGILMHTDPAFARLEESCGAFAELRRPVYYTGFVASEAPLPPQRQRRKHILVSAGGGLVGRKLFETALAAHRLTHPRTGIGLRIVTGPFYPEDDARRLESMARRTPAVDVIRALPSLTGELMEAAASISQCGYNTAMDLLRTGVPALVVPFAEGRENEQGVRAQRMAALGLLRTLRADQLSMESMAREMETLLDFQPIQGGLDLNGAAASARLALRLHLARAGSSCLPETVRP